MLAVVAVVIRTWAWPGFSPGQRAAVLALGILLFTPFTFEYDLTLLAIPVACLAWEGRARGWLPGEPVLLCLGYFMPFIAPLVAKFTHVQLGPLILAALLVLACSEKFKVQGSRFKAES
jgi:alpha-1,2-mannosyltransferase